MLVIYFIFFCQHIYLSYKNNQHLIGAKKERKRSEIGVIMELLWRNNGVISEQIPTVSLVNKPENPQSTREIKNFMRNRKSMH